MKHKLIGGINFLLGTGEVMLTFFYIFVSLPQIKELHAQFSIAEQNYALTYGILCTLIGFAIVNFYLGSKLFSKVVKTREKFYEYALFSIIFTLILTGAFVQHLTLSSLAPIYNFSTQIYSG